MAKAVNKPAAKPAKPVAKATAKPASKPSAKPSVPTATPAQQREAARYMSAFGKERGALWFIDGKAFDVCSTIVAGELKVAAETLKAEQAKAAKRLQLCGLSVAQARFVAGIKLPSKRSK